jgi:hypothetical protein
MHTTAAFAAAYGITPGLPPLRAATEAALTMEPDFRLIISGHRSRHPQDAAKIYIHDLPPEFVGYVKQRPAANY